MVIVARPLFLSFQDNGPDEALPRTYISWACWSFPGMPNFPGLPMNTYNRGAGKEVVQAGSPSIWAEACLHPPPSTNGPISVQTSLLLSTYLLSAGSQCRRLARVRRSHG